MNDILTTNEVAELLQCEVQTVEDRLRGGDLPGVKFGRSWMCPRFALLEAVNDLARQNIRHTQVAIAVKQLSRGRKRLSTTLQA